MLLIIFISLLITSRIGINGHKNDSCLEDDSICSKNAQCCNKKCDQTVGRRFLTCVSKTNTHFDKLLKYELLIIDEPTFCFPDQQECLADDECCSGRCVSVPSIYNVSAQYCSLNV